jgi:hypothetical protein
MLTTTGALWLMFFGFTALLIFLQVLKGTMHNMVWRGAEDDDSDDEYSRSNQSRASMDEDYDDDDSDSEDDEDDEEDDDQDEDTGRREVRSLLLLLYRGISSTS